MRPRNRLAYRLALPLAIFVGPALRAGAGPIVSQSAAPAAVGPAPSAPQSKAVGKEPLVWRRPGKASALPASPPRERTKSREDEDRPSSGLEDASIPRASDEVKDVTTPEQATSSTQGLSPGGSPLLLLPLPPNPEPGEARPYVGEPSGPTDAASGEIASPIGTLDAVPLPRGPEEVSTPSAPVTPSPRVTPSPSNAHAASAPVERAPEGRAAVPAASASTTDRGISDPDPVLQPPPGGDAKVSPNTAGSVVSSPDAASFPAASPAAGGSARDSGGASPASPIAPGGPPGPAVTNAPNPGPGVAQPAEIAAGAGAPGRTTGIPSGSQTSDLADASGLASSSTGGTINEAAPQGTGTVSSMDTATAFGQMVTAAVLAHELTSPARAGGGDSQAEPSKEKSPLAISDRALLAEVGGTTPLDASPGATGDAGGAGPLVPVAGTTAQSAPSVPPLGPDLALPAVQTGEGARQAAEPVAIPGTPPSSSISPAAIPEPTLLMQAAVMLAGSAFVIARRRSRG